MGRRAAISMKRETCERKIAYPTWDHAEAAVLQIIRDGISRRPNPPLPYLCPHGEHYHLGNLRYRGRWTRPRPA